MIGSAGIFSGTDILGLGSVSVDDVLYLNAYPPADVKSAVVHRERRCGGLVATALVAAARMGASCTFAGMLGVDELSNFAIKQLSSERINILLPSSESQCCPIHSTIVVGTANGTRNIFFDHIPSEIRLAEWPEENIIRNARVLIVDDYLPKTQLRAAQIARENRIPVIADFERPDAPDLAALIDLTDHLILSEDFAAKVTGCNDPIDIVRSLWNGGRSLVALTCGKSGCWFAAQDGMNGAEYKSGPTISHQPAFPVDAVDTTGCGDVFHGAYAAALVDRASAHDAIQWAAAAAAIKASRRGGQSGAPTRAEVKQFLEVSTCREQA
jgi:sulfofructose kinase